MPRVSVLIVNWNTCRQTLACLESLPSGFDGVEFEVILVDNGSIDGSVAEFRRRTDIAQLVENQTNTGFAAAVNQAFALSTSDLLLLLNSDAILDPGSIRLLVEFLDDRPEVAGAAPSYLNPDRSPQQFHFRHLTIATALANLSAPFALLLDRQSRRYRMLDDDLSVRQPIEQPSASCLLIRRSAIPPGRLMDERYPIYFNDVDFARRLARSGKELWLVPDATVVHEHGASGRLLGRGGTRQYVGALIRYLSANERPWKVLVVCGVVVSQGIVTRFLCRPGSMSLTDLFAAAKGDPGNLPRAPRA